MFLDIEGIKAKDRACKPDCLDEDAEALAALYEDRSRSLTKAYLARRKLGRKNEAIPLESSIMRRIVDALSTVYRTPPVRTLVTAAGDELGDLDPRVRNMDQVLGLMSYDLVWGKVDALRNLYRQAVVSFAESPSYPTIQMRTFGPECVCRMVNPLAADTLEEDEKILLEVADDPDVYQAWLHQDDGSWRCYLLDERGDLLPKQPYVDGVLPWGGMLPMFLVHDELPMGRAWLPIPQSRVAFALGINGLLNDLAKLVEMEAHTPTHVATDDPAAAPTETGPGVAWVTPANTKIEMLSTNPKIAEAGTVLDQMFRLWLLGEALPGDEFKSDRQVLTGTALRVRERELAARRNRQVPLAHLHERVAYDKLRTLHNYFAGALRLPRLDESTTLRVTLGRSWQPADPAELQQRYYRDMSVGAASGIDYLMERDGLTRPQAVQLYERIQVDRESYPMGQPPAEDAATDPMPHQNPGAVVPGQGPKVASPSGPGGQRLVPGAMNPDPARGTEGGSVVAAVRAHH